MELTRYEHACMVIEQEGMRLVIDPGNWTRPLAGLRDVAGVVLTHEHADHWTADHLESLLEHNQQAVILGPPGVASAAADFKITVVQDGDQTQLGPFLLQFFGQQHAVIHESIPVVDNVGVFVNSTLYYGGDSYTVPNVKVPILAAPAGAPWLKIGEAMDYVLTIAPERAFAVHDKPLSDWGLQMNHARLAWATEHAGGVFLELDPGHTLTL